MTFLNHDTANLQRRLCLFNYKKIAQLQILLLFIFNNVGTQTYACSNKSLYSENI